MVARKVPRYSAAGGDDEIWSSERGSVGRSLELGRYFSGRSCQPRPAPVAASLIVAVSLVRLTRSDLQSRCPVPIAVESSHWPGRPWRTSAKIVWGLRLLVVEPGLDETINAASVDLAYAKFL
jgi:hypothetical protein